MKSDEKFLAYCGLYCGQCSFKTAHDEEDDKHIINFPFRFDIKDVVAYNCDGCKGGHCICGNCKIKPCALEKQVANCAECKDFPCGHIAAFENDGMPHHKAAAENLRYIKKNGTKKFLEKIRPHLSCPKCGKKQSWYYSCEKHGKNKHKKQNNL